MDIDCLRNTAYLSVDRSTLSNELSKMQKDGILTVNRNRFILHEE